MSEQFQVNSTSDEGTVYHEPKQLSFDTPLAREYVKARQKFATEFLERVRERVNLVSAIDVGCGVGWFSKFLSNLNLQVLAIDGREQNVAEARLRYPEITFLTRNVEDPTLPELGSFDFVLCFGLLYHLENPFRAIRNLHSLTEKTLLVESMCVPGSEPVMDLLDEGRGENQGLDYIAFYPSEACLIKMLYRSGFPFVYRFNRLNLDNQYQATRWREKSRVILAASKVELQAFNLVRADEPMRLLGGPRDPWMTPLSKLRVEVRRVLDPRFWEQRAFNIRVIASSWLKKLRRAGSAEQIR